MLGRRATLVPAEISRPRDATAFGGVESGDGDTDPSWVMLPMFSAAGRIPSAL
jgi:hypothetical protein